MQTSLIRNSVDHRFGLIATHERPVTEIHKNCVAENGHSENGPALTQTG